MPGAQLPALAEGERAAWPVRPRTSFFPAANGPSRASEAASRSLPGPLYGPSRDLPGVQPPRTCVDLSIKRGLQPPLRGATCPGCNPRGRALSSRSGAAFSRRPRARLARGATPACRRCACKCPPAGSAPGGCPSEPPGPGPAPESGRRSSGW